METNPEYKTGIIGCGTTGKGLFDFFRGFPFHLTLVCKTEEKAKQFDETFERQLNRALKFRLIRQQEFDFRKQETVITSDIRQVSECNLIIETVTEDEEIKKELFRKLETIVSPDCILATNTSSIPPDELFSEMKNPTRCLGLHFFFPIGMQNFVEINVAKQTGHQTVEQVKSFLETIRKKHLVLSGDNHFIINRMFLKMQAGCCGILQEGKLTATQIDGIVRKNLFPAGIFRFFDTVGNDVMLQSVKNYLRYESNRSFFLPLHECLEEKVREGKLGKKTKSGFYDYPLKAPAQDTVFFNDPEIKNVLQKITGWYLEGVYGTLQKSVCTKSELEQIVREYMMVEKSPFELAAEVGYASIK